MDPNADALARDFSDRLARARENSSPTMIGRYQVIKLLGRGGMGEVYLAHDPVLDREVALKLIGADLEDPNARHRLVQEARAAGRLRHPNIVTIFDAGEHAGHSYIAMEHLGGETVRGLIQRRAPFSPGRKIALMEGACAGLAHAHRANVVHFDVKPDNLMLDARGVLKVLDFGVARVLKSEVLVTQHVAGTLRYMSPEQLSSGPLDRRSDVFSLGCSLFEFIAYEPAYVGSVHELIARITSGPVPHLAGVLPWVDPTLDAIIAKAMALDPADRFEDLDEMADALRRFREQLDPLDEPWPSSRSTAASASRRPATVPLIARPRRVAVAVLGAASAVALGAGSVWMWRPAPAENPPVAAALVAPNIPAPPPARPPASETAGSAERSAAGQKQAPQIALPGASSTAPIRSPRDDAGRPSPGVTPGDNASASRPPAAVPFAPRGTMYSPPPAVEPLSPVAPPPPIAYEADTSKAAPVLPDPAAADETGAVLAALRRYCEAYASLDPAAVQRIYPTLGSSQIEQLRRTFESTTSYDVAVGEPRVDVRNGSATARTLVTRRIVPRVGSPQSNAVETEFRLRREAGGWIITDVKANP